MNKRTDQERLLTEVLREESGAEFHEALLGETLRLARRRRRIRLAQRVSGALAVVAVIAAIAVGRIPRVPVLTPTPARNYQLTLSQPLPAASIVSTRALSSDQIVVSAAVASIVKTTTTSGGYDILGDDELLALAPQPAALVRRGPREVELVLVNSSNPNGPPQN